MYLYLLFKKCDRHKFSGQMKFITNIDDKMNGDEKQYDNGKLYTYLYILCKIII